MKMNVIKLNKILITILLAYPMLYAEAFGEIPYLLTVSYVLLDATLLYILLIGNSCVVKINTPIWCYVLFYLMAFISGVCVTKYPEIFYYRIFLGIQYCVLFIVVYQSILYDRNVKFITALLGIITTLYMLISLYRGQVIYDRLVISLHSNANSLGEICSLCMAISILIAIVWKKGWIVTIILGGLSVYCAILSGSRKAFFIVLLFASLYCVFRARTWIKRHFLRFGFILTAVAILCYLFVQKIESNFMDSVIYERILNGNQLDVGRISLYQDAMKVFNDHKLVGVGYYCFEKYNKSGLYAHSAFAEVLACTGIIGFLLWVSFYLFAIAIGIKRIKEDVDNPLYQWAFAWLIARICLDFVSISIYSPGSFITLAVVLAIFEGKLKIQNDSQNMGDD